MFIVLFFDDATSLDASKVKGMYQLTLIICPYLEKIKCSPSLDTFHFDLLHYCDELILILGQCSKFFQPFDLQRFKVPPWKDLA